MKKFNISKGLIVGLLTLALCFAAFGAVKASASDSGTSGSSTSGSGSSTSGSVAEPAATTLTTTYDAKKDVIVFTADGTGKVYYTTFKDASGKELKGTAFKSVELKKSGSDYVAEISVADKNGLKVAVNKDLFLYATLKQPANDKTQYPLAGDKVFEVKQTGVKKIVINIDYTKVAKGEDGLAISSIEITDNNKVATTYSATENASDFTALLNRLQYAVDAKTPAWLPVIAEEIEEAGSGSGSGSTSGSGSSGSGSGDASTTETTQGFTLDYVYSNLAAGKKFQFRIIGTAGTANERGCKPVKVAVKKAAKGITKLTLDVSANAAPIKNGYDFAVYKVPAAASGSGSGSTSGSGNGAGSGSGDAATKAPTTPDEGGINTWYTILPYNKEATVTDYIIPTGDFTPYKKFDSEKVTVANMFTKVKVKFVSVNDLFRLAEADKNTDSLYLYIRKSAAVGKPAGLWSSKFDVSSIAGKPVPDLLKAGETTIATKTEKEMYQAKFSAASGDTGTAFEILVINAADKAKLDDGKIDMTTAKWTKYNATKGFKLGIKSKYGEIGEKAENHELADGDYILVRRAGVKKKTLASEYVVTKISGDNWVVDKLTDGKAPAGSTSGSGSSTSGSSTSGGGTSSGS